MNEWHIQSRSHACQNCQQGFRDGSPYHTLLLDEKKEFLRLDICADCWEAQFAQARDRKGFISHWMGNYEAPPASAPDAIQKDTAETLLRKLVELNDPRYIAASYILAVMLERKRILRVKEQIRQGRQRTFIYEHPKSGDIFTIPDPDLQLSQLEEVQRMVGTLLEQGLNAGQPGAPEAPPPPPPSESASAEPEPAAAAGTPSP